MNKKWRNPNKLSEVKMKKKLLIQAISILFIVILIISCSKVPKFDHYGVYIKDNNDFKEIKGYEWSGMNDIYSNSRNFDKTQILFENEIEIYVYSPKAKLTEYKLIKPIKKSRKGDFISANFGFGRKSPEAEITIEPIVNKDDMVKIRSKTNEGTLILHIKEESKGYVFNLKNNSIKNDKEVHQTLSEKHIKKYKKETKKTINNWIDLIKKAKYREFVEGFKSPSMLNAWKNSGDYEAIIEDTIEDSGLNNGWEEIISLFEKILQDTPIIKQDHISFNNSWIELCRINGKWYQYIEIKESTSKPVERVK